MPNPQLQHKCRRLFFNKTTGAVLGIASGGGAIEGLEGDDLIRGTYVLTDPETGLDIDATTVVGCIEEFYMPFHGRPPVSIDLAQAQTCRDAVDAHRTAARAEADFVFEQGIKLLGSEQPTTESFRHALRVQEMHTRDDSERVPDHDAIVQAQTDLEALCKTCEDCCEQLLVTRDAAITFAVVES